MKHVLEVCLVAVTLSAPIAVAQSESTPTLRPGISVQMVVAGNSTPMPAADQENAQVVTVTDGGGVYLGTDPTAPASLSQKIKEGLSQGQALYIKADARTPYANVARVLEAAHIAGVTSPALLTTQSEPAAPGTIASPRGLEVLLDLPAGAVATVVELNSSAKPPVLKVNHDQISWPALQSTLMQHFQKGDEKVILVKADARASFSDVAHVIDLCRATGARVVLTPGR
jgi:biopolymer transport protein ExbD